MLSYIYRMVRDFENLHGIHPNLLYLNRLHSEHLKDAFADAYSMSQIMDELQMELIIDHDVVHPHVAWTQTAQRIAS